MQHCSYLGCPLDVLKTESGFVEKLASYVFTFFGATFMVLITIDSLYIALGLRSIWRPNPWIDPVPIFLLY